VQFFGRCRKAAMTFDRIEYQQEVEGYFHVKNIKR